MDPCFRVAVRFQRVPTIQQFSAQIRVLVQLAFVRNPDVAVFVANRLSSLDFLSPLRPGTDVTFGVVTYAGTLSLCMHYKPHRIADVQARELFDRLVRNLRESTVVGS